MSACTNHRVRMISSENIYATPHCHGTPVKEREVYKCLACGETHTYTKDLSTGKSEHHQEQLEPGLLTFNP